MHLHLFGAATPTGEAFRQLASGVPSPCPLYAYSRHSAGYGMAEYLHPADFTNAAAFHPVGDPEAAAIWISFGPIWLFAPFLAQLAHYYPDRLKGLRGLIVCSSSSVITKRYAANASDRQLVARLRDAEEKLLATCSVLKIGCRILQPTLIYGQVGPFVDRNVSCLLRLLRYLPLLPLPADSGLRQPIHAWQLAAVALTFAQQFCSHNFSADQLSCVPLGGDMQLSYRSLLEALQQAQPSTDPARRCCLLTIPNRLFFCLAAPLLLLSPKHFEAVLRMGVDLAGFTPAHRFLDASPHLFPFPDHPPAHFQSFLI